jgi:hypothetical protein
MNRMLEKIKPASWINLQCVPIISRANSYMIVLDYTDWISAESIMII